MPPVSRPVLLKLVFLIGLLVLGSDAAAQRRQIVVLAAMRIKGDDASCP